MFNRLRNFILYLWDKDYVKLTNKEKKELEEALKNTQNGEYYTHDEVWK